MTQKQRRSDPPPGLVAVAERDYRGTYHELDALIAGTRGVRSQHATDLGLFIDVYATIPRADPIRATAIAALAVLRLANERTTPTETT